MEAAKLLIVDDNESLLGSLSRVLGRDYDITTAPDEVAARKALSAFEPDIVLLDIRLHEEDPEDRAGMGLLQELLAAQPSLPVLMFSGFNDVEIAVECMRRGAADFIHKSASTTEVRQRLGTALEHARVSRKLTHLEERLQQLDPTEIIGESPQLAQVKRLIKVIAQDGYANVLVRGETGTGKEIVARAIHRLGWRSKEPFVPVAIAALNANIVESEMFGHEPGAFTGARARRIGLIEKARRGVLFLDEVGDLPPDVQLKLLRFLEERRFSRVGSSDEVGVSVQIVAATNCDLEKAVKEGRIREDLYFRLKSVQIFLPSLRERPEDIPLLTEHFLEMFRRQGRTRVTATAGAALEAMRRYAWPGNVRELKAALERAIIYANYGGHGIVEKDDLPLEILSSAHSDPPRKYAVRLTEDGIHLDEEVARLELSYMEDALALTRERKSEAWKLLGLNDRFAFLRRAKNLLKNYPHLAAQFPTLQKLYGKDSADDA